jgi:pimeloyl-ACP methyl ester carboxylesterase
MLTTSTQMITINAGDVTISGRYRGAAGSQPRALIVAIHGGSHTSKYFDASKDTSLLEFGSSMGYSVLALDRPGYGAAASLPPERFTFDSQVSILHNAIEKGGEKYGQGAAGIFLLGHSIGGMLSLLLCIKKQESPYLGMAMTGSGPVYHPRTKELFKEVSASGIAAFDPPHELKLQVLMGPKWTYSEENGRFDPERDAPSPAAELQDAVAWEGRLRREAAAVKVPVMFLVPEFDGIWRSDSEALGPVAGMFTSAPFVDVLMQRHSGHSVEMHYVARAFYMKMFAFLEECMLQRSRP